VSPVVRRAPHGTQVHTRNPASRGAGLRCRLRGARCKQAERSVQEQERASAATTAANTAANATGSLAAGGAAGGAGVGGLGGGLVAKDAGKVQAFRLLRAKKVLLALSETGGGGDDSD
jgi:hypothetical protein